MKSLETILAGMGVKTYEEFQNFKIEILMKIALEAKRIGVVKGFEYEKYDGVLGLRKYKIKNNPDDFEVQTNVFMSEDSIEVKDNGITIWNYTDGWVFDKKWIAFNRLKKIDE